MTESGDERYALQIHCSVKLQQVQHNLRHERSKFTIVAEAAANSDYFAMVYLIMIELSASAGGTLAAGFSFTVMSGREEEEEAFYHDNLACNIR